MKQITLPVWKATLFYSELWKITEFKDGCVYKTKKTGFHIHRDDDLPEYYIRVAFSTDVIRQEGDLVLNVHEPGDTK